MLNSTSVKDSFSNDEEIDDKNSKEKSNNLEILKDEIVEETNVDFLKI